MIEEFHLHSSWCRVLQTQFQQPYMQNLLKFLQSELTQAKQILPEKSLWFHALNSTPFEQVKVIILGQDPYPTPGHAHGLCFSVMPDVKPLPKSLININKELYDDLGIDNMHTGHLQDWTQQGVLLLNTVLTVQAGHANAHQKQGWEQLTDHIIEQLNQQKEKLVFILWGANAQKKGRFIHADRHCIIRSAHPSPLSAYRGFWGSKPFSRCNAYLEKSQQTAIDWALAKT